MLSNQTTYTQALANLASLLDQVIDHKEIIVIKRRGNRNVALISGQVSSLLETAYLLRSPKNAARLLSALERSKARTTESMTVDELCEELGIDSQEKAK